MNNIPYKKIEGKKKYLNKLKYKKIAILGMGYIGSNIFKYLGNIKKNISFEIIPITKKNLNLIETENFDYLINCAGNSGDFREDIIGTVDSNICLNLYLLKNLKLRERYLFLSSTRLYGFSKKKDLLFDEDYLNCPNHLSLDHIYDGSKKLVESILMNYSRKVKYKISIVRLSNIYGKFKSLDDTTLIKKMIRCAKNKRKIEINVNRKSEKDYLYVEDAIDGIMRSLLIPTENKIFNIASGKSVSIEKIGKILSLDVKYKNENDTLFSSISIEKAKNELGFLPTTKMSDALKNNWGE